MNLNLDAFIEALYEDMDGKVTSVALNSSTLDIQLEYDDLLVPRGQRSVTIRCADPKEIEVKPDFIGSLNFVQEHPLLWNHSGPQAQLFFSSAPSSPAEVFYLAHKVLEAEFAGWRKPSDYLNGKPEVFCSHLSGGYGLLARGPLRPMTALANALGSLVATNLVPSHNAETSLSVLTLESQFVVCRSVEVLSNDG